MVWASGQMGGQRAICKQFCAELVCKQQAFFARRQSWLFLQTNCVCETIPPLQPIGKLNFANPLQMIQMGERRKAQKSNQLPLSGPFGSLKRRADRPNDYIAFHYSPRGQTSSTTNLHLLLGPQLCQSLCQSLLVSLGLFV